MENQAVDPAKKKEKKKTEVKKKKKSSTAKETVGHDLTIKKHQLRSEDVKCKRTTEFSDFCLKKEILEGLNKSGFCYPSPIQELAIPVARMGADVIVQAKSGTGKTCVFSVIALENLNIQSKYVQALILAPTREIAIQIYEVTSSIGQCMSGVQIGCFIGGTSVGKDIEKLQNCHIAIGTPGRIQDLIRRESLKTSHIRLFVLDEADNLINKQMGHNEVANWIYSVLPDFKQMIAASATYPEHLEDYIQKYMKEPQQARLNPQHQSLLGLKQYYVVAKSQEFRTPQLNEKVVLLHNFLKNYKFNQALVFANSHTNAQFINKQLSILKWPAAYISSQMEQERRNDAVRRLKNFQCRILISTDLTSRGVDAKKVDCVVNFDVPYTWATYMHRIGRAGRFGGSGTALTIVSPTLDQTAFCQMVKLCNLPIQPYPQPIYKDGYRQIIQLETDNTEEPSNSIKGFDDADRGWRTRVKPQRVEDANQPTQLWDGPIKSTTSNVEQQEDLSKETNNSSSKESSENSTYQETEDSNTEKAEESKLQQDNDVVEKQPSQIIDSSPSSLQEENAKETTSTKESSSQNSDVKVALIPAEGVSFPPQGITKESTPLPSTTTASDATYVVDRLLEGGRTSALSGAYDGSSLGGGSSVDDDRSSSSAWLSSTSDSSDPTSSDSSSSDNDDSDVSSDSDVTTASSSPQQHHGGRGGIPDMSDLLRESDKVRKNTHYLHMGVADLEADMEYMIANNTPPPQHDCNNCTVVTSYPSNTSSDDSDVSSEDGEGDDEFKKDLGEYVPVKAADESEEEEEEEVDVGGYYDEDGNYYDKDGGYYDEDGNYYDKNGGYYDENGDYHEAEDEEDEEDDDEDEELYGAPVGEKKNLRNFNDGVQYRDPSLSGAPSLRSTTSQQREKKQQQKQQKEKKVTTPVKQRQKTKKQQQQQQMVPNPYCYYHHHLAFQPPPCICYHHPMTSQYPPMLPQHPMTSQYPSMFPQQPMTSHGPYATRPVMLPYPPNMTSQCTSAMTHQPPMMSPYPWTMFPPAPPFHQQQSAASLCSHLPATTPSYHRARGGVMSNEEHARYAREEVTKFTKNLLKKDKV